jgi:hypothetical protein
MAAYETVDFGIAERSCQSLDRDRFSCARTGRSRPIAFMFQRNGRAQAAPVTDSSQSKGAPVPWKADLGINVIGFVRRAQIGRSWSETCDQFGEFGANTSNHLVIFHGLHSFVGFGAGLVAPADRKRGEGERARKISAAMESSQEPIGFAAVNTSARKTHLNATAIIMRSTRRICVAMLHGFFSARSVSLGSG